MGLQTSASSPIPVRRVSQLIAGWISRLGTVWVEGQVTQISRRPGATVVFLTLRDPSADISISVTCHRRVLDEVEPPLVDGQRVVVHAKPEFYAARGTLSLAAEEIRPVGVGELLARLEHLKRVLAAEGLFAAERKRPLPFLPHTVGLVCGRGSAAEHDVLTNARRRWPAVHFRVLPVAVQGPYAVAEVTQAIQELDRDPEVDVIVVARGGGSFEDLLPFSDERLVRAIATCPVPVVSAVGHEQDTPLCDLAADARASTPSVAARLVVPDLAELLQRLDRARNGLERGTRRTLERERERLERRLDRLRRAPRLLLERGRSRLEHAAGRLRALSPRATLARGYAIVRAGDEIVRTSSAVEPGSRVEVELAEGGFGARVEQVDG